MAEADNPFYVQPRGDGVLVIRGLVEPLTKEQAVDLAAYLVATVDPERKLFDVALAALRK